MDKPIVWTWWQTDEPEDGLLGFFTAKAAITSLKANPVHIAATFHQLAKQSRKPKIGTEWLPA